MELKRIGLKLRLTVKKIVLEVRRTHLKDLRNLSFKYIKKLPNAIHLRNLVLFSSILSIVILVMFVQRFTTLTAYFQKSTPAEGGIYREGVLGNIEKINPLFTLNNAEESANRLVYSGLTRVLQNNQTIPDIAESWTLSEDKKTYDFVLRKNAKWHDGQSVTSDDVVYTIQLIQNPDTKTAESAIWKDIKVEKVNDKEVKFILPNVFSDFLTVASQPILPKHLLGEIKAQNIKIAQFNQTPVGTGPYKFIRFDQAGNEQEAVFEANDGFVLQKPYIKEIRLRVYKNFDELYKGFIRKQVDGIVDIPYGRLEKISKQSELNLDQFYLPRAQAIFFNSKNPALSDKAVRKALSEAVNRKGIIDKAIFGKGTAIYSPILPGQVGYDPTFRKDIYNIEQANSDLEKAGWIKQANGIRQKEGKDLTFNIVFAKDDENIRVLEELKNDFTKIGVDLRLVQSDVEVIQSDYVRPRNYDIILIGQDTGINPDLYSFWHSTQVNDPGLNLTGFKNREVDKFLEQIRKSDDQKYKTDRFKQIQAVLAEEVPAVYLYNPIYNMAISRSIKGAPTGKLSNSVDHLNNIYNWYIYQKVSY